MNRDAFELFIINLFGNSYDYRFKQLNKDGDGTYFNELLDSYGGTIHDVYVSHYPPIDIFYNPDTFNLSDPFLLSRLKNIKSLYEGKVGYWGMVSPELVEEDDKLRYIYFISNLSGHNRDEYFEVLLPKYKTILNIIGLHSKGSGIGSIDSFFEKDRKNAEKTFKDLIQNHKDGLSITITSGGASVRYFNSEKYLYSGVSRESKFPYEPVIIEANQPNILHEFEQLIESDSKEKEVEEFLTENYRLIFGPQYDQIETQLWLKFPEADMRNKSRRLDIFLRNSVINDWELFEVKRAINLTGNYRDIPVFSAEISHAMQQVKNYAKLLSQDSIRRKFAKEGIEYFEPSLHIVAGRRPQIPHKEWRWLLASNKEVKLITLDDLLSEMKSRTDTRFLL